MLLLYINLIGINVIIIIIIIIVLNKLQACMPESLCKTLHMIESLYESRFDPQSYLQMLQQLNYSTFTYKCITTAGH